jgi:hypothetical protein
LTSKNNDFVTINRDGINILSLGSLEKRALKDAANNDRMLHSFQSMNFLKAEPCNFILFACANMEKREVQIMQEYMTNESKSGGDNETSFDRIYNIKIWQISLRELMLFQSLYLTKTLSDIVDLVND